MSTALNKRPPEMAQDLHGQYQKISKADWADAYFDLYRQFHGETSTDEEIMLDIEHRMGILKRYRKQQ